MNWTILFSYMNMEIVQFIFTVYRIIKYFIRKKSVLASSAVDDEFEPLSDQNKDYKISIYCFSSEHTSLRIKNKDWFGLNENRVSELDDMSYANCCFSKLGLYNSNWSCWSSTKPTSSSSHRITIGFELPINILYYVEM